MSLDVNWDVDKYKHDHECEEHWSLRKAFMERWKTDYPEERLVCLAQVFSNIEFLGCSYPLELMREVANLSRDIVMEYRKSKRKKLQRTFVSASDAAVDRAKGVKREGGVIKEAPPPKNAKIAFVRQGHSVTIDEQQDSVSVEVNNIEQIVTVGNGVPSSTGNPSNIKTNEDVSTDNKSSKKDDLNNYLKEMQAIKCLNINKFTEKMFDTEFGKMVLLIRPWTSKLGNIQSSCQVCHIPVTTKYENHTLTLTIKGAVIAQATGTKVEAKRIVEKLAWNELQSKVPSLLIKEQWIEQGERVSVDDVTDTREFGKPVETSVAVKMMKMMGWKGGGLGADSQGIAEPIKPHLQMVNRAGLGSNRDIRHLKRAGQELMRRFIASDAIDLDLVFSSEFSKEERAALHQTAQRLGLASKSYGDVDRFLVVKKKLDPFSLFRAVLEKGGNTPKYQIFLPATLANNR